MLKFDSSFFCTSIGVASMLLFARVAPVEAKSGAAAAVNVEPEEAIKPTSIWRGMDSEKAREMIGKWKKSQKRKDEAVPPSKPDRNQMKDFFDAVEAFHLVGDTPGAMAVLNGYLSEIPEEAAVSSDGARDPMNLQLRDATLALALRYGIDRQAADAQRTRDLLLQFAAKIREWPIRVNRQGSDWRSQDTPSLYSNYAAGGVWGSWYHLDLRDAFPLLRAYDLIRSTLSENDRQVIVDGIFDHQVKLLLRWEPLYHNTDIYEIDGLIRFGLVLEKPEFIHLGVDRMRKLYYRGFSPDGIWHEATPAYHRQVVGPMAGLASLLKGYGDPPGWHDPQSGRRYDGLQLDEEFGAHLTRIERASRKITLPNGFLLALNDSDPDRYRVGEKSESRPELLGTSGVVVLGSGDGVEQEQVIVNFEGTHGHEHLDSNGLYWYAFGVPMFDETRYRPIAGSSSTRTWSESTYAHNTVVIDEANQPGRFGGPHREFGKDDQMQGSVTWPIRRSSGGSNHAGDLLLFDGSEGTVQAVEVEGKKAYYPVAMVYRRSVIKVSLGDGASYLVDIFRVKGGRVHEYMLHGALSRPYTAKYSLKLDFAVDAPNPTSAANDGKESVKNFLQLSASTTARQPWHVTYSIDSGPQTRTWMLSPKETLVRSLTAPAINRVGDAIFTAVRNEGGESVFVAIHEAYQKHPQIKGARLLVEPSRVDAGLAIEIDLGNRKDLVLSTFGDDREVRALTTKGAEITLKGRLAWIQTDGEALGRAILWDGTALGFDGTEVVSSPRAAITGTVIKTLRQEVGDEWDALVVDGDLPLGDLHQNSVVHVQFGELLTWSYRLEEVKRGNDGNWILRLEHEPGFEIQPDGLAKMLFHPGWGHRGDVRFRIPLVRKASAK